jgi:geranylgeranyl diphosphate synthase, type II
VIETQLAELQARIEAYLDQVLALPDPGTPRLREAMRYSALGGGKRLRPMLVYLTGQALGASLDELDVPAAAVELIHVYSLVHDDLPAMDDDDLRRGRPTCHKAFDEATAILVGDSLQAYAFELLAGDDTLSDAASALRLTMIRVLADRIGTRGMAGGQAIDLGAVGRGLSLPELESMHRRKTGALIEASVLLGAVAAGVRNGPRFEALRTLAAEIGLAFQIQDDILDVSGDAQTLGKATGADAAHNKPTYPSTLGLEAARARALDHERRALAALDILGPGAQPLRELARLMVDRRS